MPPQVAVLVLALALAALSGAESIAAGLLAYAGAWLALNVLAARRVPLPKLSSRVLWVGVVLVVATPVSVLAGRLRALAEHESLVGLDANLGDRLRLERSVAIHPALLVSDRPQSFFVRADGARRVRVTLAPGLRSIDADALGAGLFRVDYDPREHRSPRASGTVEARLEIDGRVSERAMHVVLAAAHPRQLRVSPDGARACTTSEETDDTLVVDAQGKVLHIASDDGPADCAWTDTATVAIAHRYSPRLTLATVGTDRAAHVDLGAGQRRVAVSHGGALLAVALESARAEVVVVDVASRREVARLALGGSIDQLVFGADARTLLVARRAPTALLRVSVDAHTLRVAQERPLLAPALTLTALDGGARVVLAATDWSADATPHLGNHYVQDQLLTFDAQTLALVAQRHTARRSPRQDAAGDVDRGISPLGLFATPSGAWLVAFAGSDELTRLDPRGGAPQSFDVAALGLSAPQSVVLLTDPRTGTPALVATSPSSGRLAVLDPSSGELRATIFLAPDDATLLRDDPDALQRRFGERAFYEGTRSGVSCQSCHPDAGSDEMAHNIGGRVLAPTLDVRGIGGTSPYLRDGSYPRMGDLFEVAQLRYRGYREPAGDRGATLDAWIASLPLQRSLAPRELPRERRGFAVFVRAGCPTCHAAPAMTNLGSQLARAVFPRARSAPGASLDTPSLRAVSRRSRWLQDGRAASLRAIFSEQNPDDRHGHTRGLSRAALDDLVGFLESL